MLDHAQIGGGAPHVDDDGILQAAEIAGPPDGVGGAAGDGEDGVAPGVVHGHEGAVVLGEVDLGIGDPQVGQRAGEALGEGLGHLVERGVENGGVLPLNEAHGADLAGDGHVDVLPHHLAAQPGGRPLVVVPDGGEHAGDGHRAHPFGLQPLEEGAGRLLIKGGQLLAVVLKAAADDGGVHGDGAQILRPVHHGRDAHRGGGADAQHADGGQVAALHNGVGALGGAQHGLADLPAIHAGLLQHRADGVQDAVVGVGGGVALYAGHHLEVFVDEHRVGIGAAHVNS